MERGQPELQHGVETGLERERWREGVRERRTDVEREGGKEGDTKEKEREREKERRRNLNCILR